MRHLGEPGVQHRLRDAQANRLAGLDEVDGGDDFPILQQVLKVGM
jgi:hypothetical protein